MNRRRLHRLLGELTPDILSYLFPGLERPEADVCESGIGGVCLDWMVETEAAIPEPAAIPEAAVILHRRRKSVRAEKAAFPASVPVADGEALDPRTEQILAEIRRLQEKYDVSIDELEVLLGYTVQLSRLRITPGGKLFLSDYGDREVKMPNVAKALYFLYLRHPEGLRYKDIADHRDELLHIYGSISGRDEPEEMERSMDILVDPYGNGLNVNASRIKTAFRNVVSDRIARFYYIVGAAGDVKKVPLDRDLVIWDY